MMSTLTHTMEDGFCTMCGETEEWLSEHGRSMVDNASVLKPGTMVALGASGHQAWEVESVTKHGVRIKTDRTSRLVQDAKQLRILAQSRVELDARLRNI